MPKFLDKPTWFDTDSSQKTSIGQDEQNGTIQGNDTPYQSSTIPGASATGVQAVAFGGKRYDKLSDGETPNQQAIGNQSFAAGASNVVKGDWSASFGADNETYLKCAFAEGKGNVAGNKSPSAAYTQAYGEYSDAHAEGVLNTASGFASHAEGGENTASGHYSHAGGFQNTSSGDHSTTIGASNTASGKISFAGGNGSKSTAEGAVTFGYGTQATGKYSVAVGTGTIAQKENQTVVGAYNETSDYHVFIVGDGNSSKRKNAFQVRSVSGGSVAQTGYTTSSGGWYYTDLLTEREYEFKNVVFVQKSGALALIEADDGTSFFVPKITKALVNSYFNTNDDTKIESLILKTDSIIGNSSSGSSITLLRSVCATISSGINVPTTFYFIVSHYVPGPTGGEKGPYLLKGEVNTKDVTNQNSFLEFVKTL